VAKGSSGLGGGSAKEQLIQRLEQARLDTSTLNHSELISQLKQLHLSTEGSKVSLCYENAKQSIAAAFKGPMWVQI
jgi:hypothetical protein